MLKSQINSMTRKLTLEKKVKQAAQSLHRLDNAVHKWQKKNTSDNAYSHLDEAQKKCDEITSELWRLTSLEMEVERKLLNHNAAVLSMGMNILERKAIEPTDEFGEGHLYQSLDEEPQSPTKISPSAESISKAYIAEITEAQNRLRELNFHVATLARSDISSSPPDNLVGYIDQLKSNIQTLSLTHTNTTRDLQSTLTDSQRIIDQLKLRERDQSEAIKKQTSRAEDLDRRLLQTQREFDRVQNEVDDQNEVIANLKQEVRTAREEARIAETVAQGREAESLRREKSLRRNEAERLTVEIAAKEDRIRDLSHELELLQGRLDASERSMKDAQAKVDEASRQHNDTIRDLESQIVMLKSETASLKAEKEEMAGTRQQRAEEVRLQREHDLAKERQALEIRANEKIVRELETTKAQNAQLAKELEMTEAQHKATETRLMKEIESLEKLLAEPKEDSVIVLNRSSQDSVESSREKVLEARCNELQAELSSILDDFERLTSQFIDHESFRQTLEAQVDALRDQCNNLQTELAEEKVRSLGRGVVDSSSPLQGAMGVEQTSTTTLRSEFRKMVSEMRQEHLSALKVSSLI